MSRWARIFPNAKIEVGDPEHPVSRGWSTFVVEDEPYMNNYFGTSTLKPRGTTYVLATSMLPPDEPVKQILGWGVSRPDGGRGAGIVMPHFYKNWANRDLRTLVLNSVLWTALMEVPEEGVQSEEPDLEAFLDSRSD